MKFLTRLMFLFAIVPILAVLFIVVLFGFLQWVVIGKFKTIDWINEKMDKLVLYVETL